MEPDRVEHIPNATRVVAYVRMRLRIEVLFITTDDERGRIEWGNEARDKYLPEEVYKIPVTAIDARMSIRI